MIPSIHRRSSTGLDVGAHSVKAVQCARAHGRWEIAASARFPRPNPNKPLTPEEASEIRSVLRRQGFSGNDIIIAANPEKLPSSALELPAKRADIPLDQIAQAEFARIQKCDLATAEFAWWELPVPVRGGKGTHVMAVAYPHAEAEAQLAPYEAAGFRVAAIEPPAAALARIALGSAPGHSTVAVLDLGWRSATLSLLRNGAVAYERKSPANGLSALHSALASRLRVEPSLVEEIMGPIGASPDADRAAVELATEARPLIVAHLNTVIEDVLKAMAYTAHRYPEAPVSALVLTGGGACIPDLAEHVASAIGVEVRTADPGQISASAKSRGVTASHATAAGLASHATASPPPINLIPLQRQLHATRAARLRAWSAAAGGLLLAEVFACGALAIAPSQLVAPPPEAFVKASTEVSQANQSVAALRRELASAKEEVASRRFVIEQPDYSLLLAMVSQRTAENVALSQCELAVPVPGRPQTLKISGFARNQPAVASFMLALESSGVFRSVTLLRSNQQPLMNTATAAFQVECALGPSQKGGQP